MQVEALVLATKNEDAPPSNQQLNPDNLLPSQATLIVVPPALLPQWKEEITKTTQPGTPIATLSHCHRDCDSDGCHCHSVILNDLDCY